MEQLSAETQKPYYRDLDAFLDREVAAGKNILPAREDIFNALKFTPFAQVKVVLLGQDPYPNPDFAHGLCFSVKPAVRKLPASLKNIFKELGTDVGCQMPNNGYLESWARQGVLMLNTLLTLEAGISNSHKKRGWEQFTDRIIELVAAKRPPVVFLLWGGPAQKKEELIKELPERIIKCAHPSPLAGGKFFGSRCFSRTNQLLAEAGVAPIDWQIPQIVDSMALL